MRILWLLATAALTACSFAGQSANLATFATASASESQSAELSPVKAIDANMTSRWSGIPGHNSGVWYQLDWPAAVNIGEVVVHQYERYAFEWDIQTWDSASRQWIDVGHYGRHNVRLPLTVVCPIAPARSTTKLRIANITNGPSFTEVEVFDSEHVLKPVISLASDLQGNFVGMLCDAYGGSPIPGQPVTLRGDSDRGSWLVSAKSDSHGMFFAPMPVGLRGSVLASSPAAESRRFFAQAFQRTVTPVSRDASIKLLDQGWRFRPNPPAGFEQPRFSDSGWAPIHVPAHWAMEGFKGDSGGYRLHFTAPAESGRSILRFDGVYSGADVWLNGQHIAYHEGGFTPFEADVTSALRPGVNVLAVRVAEHSLVSDDLDKMSQYADFPLAGIIRKVTLFRVPDVHVEAYDMATRLSSDGRSALVTGHVRVIDRSPQPFSGHVTVILAAPGGHEVAAMPKSAMLSLGSDAAGTVPFALNISEPHAWSAEHPNLYGLRIRIESGHPIQTLWQRVGLRETEIQGTQILIDRRPVKFRGTCHHDSYPTMGRAVTPAIERRDVSLIKQANLNALRTSHYPPLPELLDEADRQGLYVEDEADFCWVSVSDDLRNAPRIIQLEGEMVARDRNHPSVFIWSLCNESGFGYDFERAHEFVRATDPSRPTSAATSAWTEVATEHNPISLARLKEVANIDKPLLWDEAWCIYQGIFGDVGEMWLDPGLRDYYAEPLPAIYDAFMASKTVSGSMIWAWSDDLFCVPGTSAEYGRGATQSHFVDAQYLMPGRGIVGDAPWGVVDGWRRPKPEFWITKKLQSPIRMHEDPYTVRHGKSGREVELAVTNQYDFTNLAELNVTWASGGNYGVCAVDVAPRTSGVLRINPADGVGKLPLRVAFRTRAGDLVDEYAFPPSATSPTAADKVGGEVAERDESELAGDVAFVTGPDFELGFDKEGGWLRRCVAGNAPLLLGFPMLHVLPTATPFEPVPKRLEWKVDDFYVGKEGPNGRVVEGGHYSDFKGGYELTIQPSGVITVHAKFTYSGPDVLAREVGLSFDLPRACTQLTWQRKGEWGVYPADDIGRPVGTAKAFYDHGGAVPPTWPWSQDDSPMGSNDFRSTKRHIVRATVGYPGGASVEISSDGSQSIRAYVDSDRVTVAIDDWYGGTNVGWNEWISNYGRGKLLKKGDVIESTLRLKLNAHR